MTETVLGKIAVGAFWTVFARISVRLIGLASTIILARLLTPHDFGLVALAMIFVAFLELLGAFNFDTVIIQIKEPTRDHYDTAWSINAVYFTVGGLLLALLSPYISKFYSTPQLKDVIYVLSVGFILAGFVNVKTIDFQKDFKFGKEYILMVSTKLSSFLVTITIAFIYKNYWALLAGVIVGRIANIVVGYYLAPYLPRFTFKEFFSLYKFSGWLLIRNFISFTNSQSDRVAVGKLSGTGLLGVYSLGSSVAYMLTQELIATVDKASYPGYAKIADDVDKLRSTMLSVLSTIYGVSLPLCVGLYWVSNSFVPLFLGQKWYAAIPIVKVVAISSLIFSFQTNYSYIYYAMNKPHVPTYVALVRAVLLVIFLGILVPHFSIEGAAWAALLTSITLYPLNVFLISKLIGTGLRDLLTLAYRPLLAAAAMSCALFYLPLPFGGVHAQAFHGPWEAFVTFAVSAIAGAAVYSIALITLWWAAGRPTGFERHVWSWLRGRFAA